MRIRPNPPLDTFTTGQVGGRCSLNIIHNKVGISIKLISNLFIHCGIPVNNLTAYGTLPSVGSTLTYAINDSIIRCYYSKEHTKQLKQTIENIFVFFLYSSLHSKPVSYIVKITNLKLITKESKQQLAQITLKLVPVI